MGETSGGSRSEVPRFSELRTLNFELRIAPFSPVRHLPRPAGNDLSSVLDSLSPMAPSPQHSVRKLSHKPSLFLALLCRSRHRLWHDRPDRPNHL